MAIYIDNGKVVTEVLKLTKAQRDDLNKGIPVYIQTGRNIMSEPLYTKITKK